MKYPYRKATTNEAVDGSGLVPAIQRIFVDSNHQEKLYGRIAKLILSKKVFNNNLPDYFLIPGRGGFFWIEGIMKALGQRDDLPTLMSYESQLYSGEKGAADIKQDGLDRIIERIKSEKNIDEEITIGIIDDIIDTVETTETSAQYIVTKLTEPGYDENKIKIKAITPFGKRTKHLESIKVLKNNIHYIFDTKNWVVYLHELHGLALSNVYQFVKQKLGRFTDILFGDQVLMNKNQVDFSNMQSRTEAAHQLAVQYALDTYKGKPESLPYLVVSVLPDENNPNDYTQASVGGIVNDVLRSWSQIDIIRKFLRNEIITIPDDKEQADGECVENGYMIPHTTITQKEGSWLPIGNQYIGEIGDRKILVVAQKMPDSLTKKKVADLYGVNPSQIQFASLEHKELDYHL